MPLPHYTKDETARFNRSPRDFIREDKISRSFLKKDSAFNVYYWAKKHNKPETSTLRVEWMDALAEWNSYFE